MPRTLKDLAATPPDEAWKGMVRSAGSQRASLARFRDVSVYLWHNIEGASACLIFNHLGDFARVPYARHELEGSSLKLHTKGGGVWEIDVKEITHE